MSTTTTNYGLIKPDTTDPILIGQLNDNSDAIDAALKENADAIENKPDAADIPTPSTTAPAMDGTAAAGTSTNYARADHVHPSDTSKQDALTTAQLAAVNSGINSTKVEDIDENRAALVELVEGGAKNLFQISANAYQSDINGLTATFNADGSVTVTGTMSDPTKNAIIYISPNRNMDYRKYQGCVLSGGISANERITLQNSVSPYNSIAISTETGVEITNIIPEKTLLFINIVKRSTAVNYTFKPMICTKAAWGISHEYQPYRPSYQELYERVVALEQANQ